MTIQYAKRMAAMIIDRAEFCRKEYGASDRYLIPITDEQIEGLKLLIAEIQSERLSRAIDEGIERSIKALAEATPSAIDMIDVEKLMKL